MKLELLIGAAMQQGASDLHLEACLPMALRIRGTLRTAGDPVTAVTLAEIARELVAPDAWPLFLERGSCDLSRTIHGVRCRINLLHTARGIGLAIRLLSSFQPTIDKLNLHPDLKKLISPHHGLILVCGPTGSGKSSTLAALIQEINLTESRHIVTIESPIEYTFYPRRAFIRQREVGRDTPSFDQALLDVLREDPDVVMVGEMRDPETMRLTLNASETGHLVLATVHSATCIEALQRMVAAFPAEIQHAIAAQLAECLVGVVSQRLRYRPDLCLRLPECEVLMPTNPVRHFIRSQAFFKINSVLETGAEHGMWTFARYRTWMDKRSNWHLPDPTAESSDEEAVNPPLTPPKPEVMATGEKPTTPENLVAAFPNPPQLKPAPAIEIEPVEGGLSEILKQLE